MAGAALVGAALAAALVRGDTGTAFLARAAFCCGVSWTMLTSGRTVSPVEALGLGAGAGAAGGRALGAGAALAGGEGGVEVDGGGAAGGVAALAGGAGGGVVALAGGEGGGVAAFAGGAGGGVVVFAGGGVGAVLSVVCASAAAGHKAKAQTVAAQAIFFIYRSPKRDFLSDYEERRDKFN
jgi:hypothetical protein